MTSVPEVCKVKLNVREGRNYILQPGQYSCMLSDGHDKGDNPTPHKSVVRWKEVSNAKPK